MFVNYDFIKTFCCPRTLEKALEKFNFVIIIMAHKTMKDAYVLKHQFKGKELRNRDVTKLVDCYACYCLITCPRMHERKVKTSCMNST